MEAVRAEVYYNDILAGFLTKSERGYEYNYADSYLTNDNLPPISLSFPKQPESFFQKLFSRFSSEYLLKEKKKICSAVNLR